MLSKKEMPDLNYERQVGYPYVWVAGADEVGRGCLAGPVVAAAVILPRDLSLKKDPWFAEINDSKRVSPKDRERLSTLIIERAHSYSIASASVEEINQINIFHASHLAISRALIGLQEKPDHILIDGKFLPKELPAPASAVIKGDQKSLSIAAASIIAKVWRDRLMIELDQKFPVYGFAQHKGYPTPGHAEALRNHGICEIHRKAFGLVSLLA